MIRSIVTLMLAVAGTSSLTAAQNVVDVNQPSVDTLMAYFSQADLAQSFQPTATNCNGGGVSLTPGWGTGGTLTVELWDALPNAAGANLLATGSESATPGTWVNVFWPQVPVTPGNTYYMVYSCTDPNMALDGNSTDPYADGQVHANTGFLPFPDFDYAFNTWTDATGTGLTLTATGTCPGVIDFSLTGATPDGAIVLAFGPAGSFTVPDGNCLGVALDISVPEIAAVLNADAAGEINLSPSIPSSFCGMTLQAVDMTACSASNSIVL